MMRTKLAALLMLLCGGAGCELADVGPADDPAVEYTVPPPDSEVNPTRSVMSSMPGCGTVLASWNGTAAYSNGPNTATGFSCGGGGKYGLQYQCVELVMRHFKINWNLSWWGNAKDLLNNAPRAQVDVFTNGNGVHSPVPGDMIVWPNGGYGHVALVTSVHAGGIDIIEQNVSGNGRATLPWDGRNIGARWGGSWVPTGWAHAKANGGGGPPPPTTPPPPPPPPPPTTPPPPPPGVNWSCAKSSYQGQQFWTCSGGSRYRCDSAGKPQQETCASGCIGAGLGKDDYCAGTGTPPPPTPPVSWSCAKSSYQGQQIWTCSSGSIYRCDAAGKPQMLSCPKGCNVMPLGVDDTCT
jgi:hypothetical protein